jgi:hypothetical protein
MGTPEHQQLDTAFKRIHCGSEFGDGGRDGVIAALETIVALFTQLLPPKSCDLLRPFRYEIDSLAEIDGGIVRPIHKPRDDRVRPAPKAGNSVSSKRHA